MRDATIFAALLAVAACLVVAGVALVYVPLALIVAGPLLGGWAWLVLGGEPEPAAIEGDE